MGNDIDDRIEKYFAQNPLKTKRLVCIPVDDLKLLYSFVPEWAKNTARGLCATMYGTGTYEGDSEVVERVETIRERLSIYHTESDE